MSAAPSGFGAVPLAYAKGTVKPRRGWRSTWRAAAAGAAAAAAAPSATAATPSAAPAAPRSWATLPPPTKNAGSGKPASSTRITAPFSRYPRKAASSAASLAPTTSSSASPVPFPPGLQQQIPVVYRSAPYRREAEREKVEFRIDLEETSSSSRFSSSPSLTPRVLFVDDGGGARARLAAALFASALAEVFPASSEKNGEQQGIFLTSPPRIEFAVASVGPAARAPPDEAVVAAARRAGVASFFARGGAAATTTTTGSLASSSSSSSPSTIEEADLVRADLCLVCDRYDAEDLLRDAAALDGSAPGAFYSARVRKLSAFAPAAAEWCDAARERSRGGSRGGGGRGRGGGGSAAVPLLFLDPGGDIDDPLYGSSYPSFSSSAAVPSLGSNDSDGELDEDEEESELSDALDATVAQLRLATRGLLQFLLKLEERRHFGTKMTEESGRGDDGGKNRRRRQPLLSLHAALRQAILCPLLSPEAERGGRGPAAAVSVLQAKAVGWRPVWQEEREGEWEEEDGSEVNRRTGRKKTTFSLSSPSSSSSTTTTTTTTTALYTLKTSKAGRQIISRKLSVEHGHWRSVANVDAALLRFIERKRKRMGSVLGAAAAVTTSSASPPPSPSSSPRPGRALASRARPLTPPQPPNPPPPPPPLPLLFPTQAELRAAGEASVAKAANSAGGLAAAARRLGFKPAHRARGWWRDFDAVAEELRDVARAAALEEGGGGRSRESGGAEEEEDGKLVLSMPTQAQLVAAGKGALLHAIRRHGGAQEVARRAGLRCLGRSGVRRGGAGAEEEEEEEEEEAERAKVQ